jgi:catechol 2,3-dioxygenase-like lactoylglutathione lyase family enzyme
MEHKQLPEVGQVAIVVKNLEEAITYWSEMLNVGPFKKIEYSPEKSVVRGKNVPIKLKLAFANGGKQNLEIIEVAEGDPQHIEFLEKTGGGVHHLGFYVHDLEQWVDYFEKRGISVLMEMEGIVGPRGRRRVVYFETSKSGVLLEFIQVL